MKEYITSIYIYIYILFVICLECCCDCQYKIIIRYCWYKSFQLSCVLVTIYSDNRSLVCLCINIKLHFQNDTMINFSILNSTIAFIWLICTHITYHSHSQCNHMTYSLWQFRNSIQGRLTATDTVKTEKQWILFRIGKHSWTDICVFSP